MKKLLFQSRLVTMEYKKTCFAVSTVNSLWSLSIAQFYLAVCTNMHAKPEKNFLNSVSL
jgi:hypothetical protein